MTTLVGNVTSSQKYWNVSAVPEGDYLQVDDEIVRILDKRSTHSQVYVERGWSGTTPATHSNGATLTTLWVPSTGGGGQEQVIPLGPFTVTFDNPEPFIFEGANGTWLHLADVVAGTRIVAGYVTVITGWDTDSANVSIMNSAEEALTVWNVNAGQESFLSAIMEMPQPGGFQTGLIAAKYLVDDIIQIKVDVDPAPTAGLAMLEFLITVPA